MKVSEAGRRYVRERRLRGELTGESPRTVAYTVGAFARATGDPELDRLNRRHVERWLERPVAPSTKRAQLSIVRVFCEWQVERGNLRRDPTLGVRGPRQPRRVPRNLRRDVVASILACCPDERARVVVLLMVQEGLRCCEVATIEVGDINWSEASLLVRHGKGDHQRVLPLSPETVLACESYLRRYPASSGPLVRSYQHPRCGMTPKYISRLVVNWITVAGVKNHAKDGVSAHALRHSAATDMLRAGAHLRDVQAALGHQSLQSTEPYLAWIIGDLRTAMGGRTYGSDDAA